MLNGLPLYREFQCMKNVNAHAVHMLLDGVFPTRAAESTWPPQ